jgi:xylose isomerase
VWEFAAGCMRNYLILKEKARQFDEDKEIQGLLAEIRNGDGEPYGRYSKEEAKRVKELSLDRAALTSKALPYERLDQLTVDILFGVR